MNYRGIPVVINHEIGEPITRTKRWKRRGIGRLPKVRTRVVGRKPEMYYVNSKLFGRSMIVTNPEGLAVLQESEKDVGKKLQERWLEGQVRDLQEVPGLRGPSTLLR